MYKVYVLENLGCANCAAKIEAKISRLPGVVSASIAFATRQLRLEAENPDGLLAQMQAIAAEHEPDIVITEQSAQGEKETAAACGGSCGAHHHAHGRRHPLMEIGGGAALFLLGMFLPGLSDSAALFLLAAAYVILGGRIVSAAARNLLRGNVFDENFLMSIATLGAFAIQEYPEAVGVMLFFRVGEYFEHRAVEKSRSQIMAAVDLRPETVNRVERGGVVVVPAGDVRVNDIILVRPGDRIPLDGVVVDGVSRIDTSPVTGEPVPVGVTGGAAVLSGCVNGSGALQIRVEKALAESMVTRIVEMVENAAAAKPQMDRFITRFARVYTPLVVVIAATTAVIPSLITGDWSYWTYSALTFLVISCPCALVLSVPLAFFSGIGAGSKRGILFKGGAAMEALKNIRAVVMDKTGTITEGNFVVQEIFPRGVTQEELLRLAASCEAVSTHPIGVSIVQAADGRKLVLSNVLAAEEIAGRGLRVRLPEGEALCGSAALLAENGVEIAQSARTAAGAEVFVALNGKFAGQLFVADTIKADAAASIAALQRLGLKTAMLTGDAQANAEAVAAKVGIGEVRAKLLPEEKLTELSSLRAQYGGVMFVGDGLNDAPVLAGADVGAAMGSGADAAIEAADVVFMTSRMEAIPKAIAIARQTAAIAWQNIAVALAVKIAVMIMGLAGYASMWMAVFADTGVAMLCVLNSVRLLYKKA